MNMTSEKLIGHIHTCSGMTKKPFFLNIIDRTRPEPGNISTLVTQVEWCKESRLFYTKRNQTWFDKICVVSKLP